MISQANGKESSRKSVLIICSIHLYSTLEQVVFISPLKPNAMCHHTVWNLLGALLFYVALCSINATLRYLKIPITTSLLPSWPPLFYYYDHLFFQTSYLLPMYKHSKREDTPSDISNLDNLPSPMPRCSSHGANNTMVSNATLSVWELYPL